MAYQLILFIKFLGILLYAGGVAGAFLVEDPAARRRATHLVASPGLALTWTMGYLLARTLHIRFHEIWILGGFWFSLASLLMLIRSVKRGRRTPGAFLATAAPYLMALALMIFRPS